VAVAQLWIVRPTGIQENMSDYKRPSSVSRRKAKFYAVSCFGVAVISLVGCIHGYLRGSFLKSGSAFNAELVDDMRVIIKVATFIVIPGLSILLIFCSRLIWKLSKEIRDDS
jgi:hypothetical protein